MPQFDLLSNRRIFESKLLGGAKRLNRPVAVSELDQVSAVKPAMRWSSQPSDSYPIVSKIGRWMKGNRASFEFVVEGQLPESIVVNKASEGGLRKSSRRSSRRSSH